MSVLVWETSTDNVHFTQMKSPSTYKVSYEDIDRNSYRNPITTNLVRTPLAKKLAKVSLSFNFLTKDEMKAIAQAVNPYPLYVKIYDPFLASVAGTTTNYVSFKAYVSKMDTEIIEKQAGALENRGYRMSFNIVQANKVANQ